jgi:hypothetical protein
MKNKKRLIVPILLCIGLVVVIFPIQHNVSGNIDDFILNDNGLGLKVNGVIYWLSYDNIHSNINMRSWKGCYCDLTYTSFGFILLNGCGGPTLYVHTDNLTVSSVGG